MSCVHTSKFVGLHAWSLWQLTLMTSQPVSSPTTVGLLKGKHTMTPFSVPTHSDKWAAVNVDTKTGIRLVFFSEPNTVEKWSCNRIVSQRCKSINTYTYYVYCTCYYLLVVYMQIFIEAFQKSHISNQSNFNSKIQHCVYLYCTQG